VVLPIFKNRFVIAFEGIDGSGKTTQCKMLVKYLKNNGIRAIAVGRRFIGSTIFALLFPSFSGIIVADRYIHTIKVYLRHKRHKGIGSKLAAGLINILPPPKLLFYLDIDIKSALERIAARGKKPDKYETKEGLEIFAKGFEMELAKSGRIGYNDQTFEIHKLNAAESPEPLHEKIVRIISSALLSEKAKAEKAATKKAKDRKILNIKDGVI
jgi:thymidylate kinase